MRIPIPVAPLALALLALAPADLSAQTIAGAWTTLRDAEPVASPGARTGVAPGAVPARIARAEERSLPALVGAGILGGAVGAVVGGYAGAVLSDGDSGDDLDVVNGLVVGAAVGEAVFLPLGVHLADGGDGSYALSALVSLGLAGVGLLALEAVHYDPPGAPIVLVAVPVAQLAAAIAIERASSPGR